MSSAQGPFSLAWSDTVTRYVVKTTELVSEADGQAEVEEGGGRTVCVCEKAGESQNWLKAMIQSKPVAWPRLVFVLASF